MSDKLKKYLDEVLSPYEDLHVVKELKEELYSDLREKMNDLKNSGHDDEAAYRMTINSIGDISDIVETITAKTRELQQIVGMDYTKSNLQNSDLQRVKVHDGKFNYSNLKGSDFSGSDLTNSSFKCCDLRNVTFDDANLTGAKINMADLKAASFKNCILNNTDFRKSNLSDVSFDNLTLNGTIFDHSALIGTSFKNAIFRNVSFKGVSVKKAIFDGATMDKLTYAILKNGKANLTNVTVI